MHLPPRAKPRFDASRNQWRLKVKGRHHYLCSGAANEALAWREAARITGSTVDPIARPATVTQLADAWVQLHGTDWHDAMLAPLQTWAVGRPLADLPADFLAQYLDHLRQAGYVRTINGKPKRRAYSTRTLRHQLRCAMTVLQWGKSRRWLTEIPTSPRLPKAERLDRSLTQAQLGAVFAALPARAAAALRFQLLTGARPGEVCYLKWSEIRDTHCELRRGKTYARTGRPRVLPITPAVKAVLDAQARGTEYVFTSRLGRPYSPSGLRAILKRAGRKAGLTLTGAYQLRHSFAQLAIDSGRVGVDQIGAILGHEPGSRETAAYLHIRQRQALAAAEVLSDVVSPGLPPVVDPASAPAAKKRRKTDPVTPRKTATRRDRRVG